MKQNSTYYFRCINRLALRALLLFACILISAIAFAQDERKFTTIPQPALPIEVNPSGIAPEASVETEKVSTDETKKLNNEDSKQISTSELKNKQLESDNPIDTYISKNGDSPVVKYFLQDPNDAVAIKALGYEIALSSHDLKNTQPEVFEKIRSELDELLKVLNQVASEVQNGISLERAKQMVYRKNNISKTNSPNSNRQNLQ